MPPITIETSSPNPTIDQVEKKGIPSRKVNCPATVNIETEKTIAVIIILYKSFLTCFVKYRQSINTKKVDIPPIGTSSIHVGDIKFAIMTPKVTAKTYRL